MFSVFSSSKLFFCCLLFLAVFPSFSSSHATLLTPQARTGQAVGNGIKIPSLPVPQGITCGGSAAADPGAGPIVATYTAGQQLTVQWDIHIDHQSAPGVSIAVQYSNTDSFANNVLATGVDVHNQLSGTTAQVDVTLPAGKTSNAAVLQWIWATTTDGGYYVGCSDIAIVAPAAVTTIAPAATTTAAASNTSAITTAKAGGGSVTTTTVAFQSNAFAIRYSVSVLALLFASLVAAFLYF